MSEITPVLYIFMRSDLDSMNPGKAMAQASHATSMFTKIAEDYMKTMDGAESDSPLSEIYMYPKWKNSTVQNFGTVLVYDCGDEMGLNEVIFDAQRNGVDLHGIIHDPTYPVKDGSVTHYIPVNTCGFAFSNTGSWSPNRNKYKLYK